MNVLEEANKITHKDRQDMYGPPKENMEHIASISSSILNREISARDIVMIMLAIKLSREMYYPKRDNRTDLAGYTYVLDKVMEETPEEELIKHYVGIDVSKDDKNTIIKIDETNGKYEVKSIERDDEE